MRRRTKDRQSVRVTTHRTSTSIITDQQITHFELPIASVGLLVDILMRAVRDGYTNRKGEVCLYLSALDGTRTTSHGHLGVLRKDASKREAALTKHEIRRVRMPDVGRSQTDSINVS